ncbi:hypothetical protein QYF36_000387 [Acer negundo]|nr:hypothetical protein QYF36_000387 [Acer negundo]
MKTLRRERKEEKKPEKETAVVAVVIETAARPAVVAALSVAEPRQPRTVAAPLAVAHLSPSNTSRRHTPLSQVSFAVPVGNDSSTLTTSLFKTQNVRFGDKSWAPLLAVNLKSLNSQSRNRYAVCMSVQQASRSKVAVSPLELEDAKEPPLNLYKPKEPYTSTIVSVERVVGPKASGETCHIVIDHDGNVPYWEGQSYSDLVYWTFGPVMLV